MIPGQKALIHAEISLDKSKQNKPIKGTRLSAVIICTNKVFMQSRVQMNGRIVKRSHCGHFN